MTDHIQINAVSPCVIYQASGTQRAFSFSFAIFKAEDMEVWLNDQLQIQGYDISGVGISSGGTVTFAVPPPTDAKITLRRQMAVQRTCDFQVDGFIRANTLNDEFDYQVAAIQQVSEAVGRAVKRHHTSISTADLTLPDPVGGRALMWNGDGSGLTNSTQNVDAVLAGANAAQTAALTSAQAASSSASQASISANAATVSAADAAVSAASADNSASSANAAAASAVGLASAADGSAVLAAAASSAAAAAAATANAKALDAVDAASAALASANGASASAAAAAGSASSASASAASALACYDSFDDRYLGAKASDPALDNDGNALLAGALYFNSVGGVMKVYNGLAWNAAYVSGAGFLASANNLSELTSPTTARANLGLGSAALLVSDTDTGLTANSDGRAASQKAVKAYVDSRPIIDTQARDQLALTNLRQELFCAVSTGGLVQGYQWELATDDWAAASSNQSYVVDTIPYYAVSRTLIPQASGTIVGGDLTYSGGLAAAFDGNAGTWAASASGSGGSVTKYWGSGVTKTIHRVVGALYQNASDNSTVSLTVTLYGSSDNSSWTSLGTCVSSVPANVGTVFTLTPMVVGAYAYHKLSVSAGYSSVGFQDINLYEGPASSSMLLVSPTVPLSSVPLAANAYFLWKDDGPGTNLCLYSEDLSNAAWLKIFTTITANSGTAPDGAMTADALVENTASSEHFLVSANCNANPSGMFTFSVWAKPLASGRRFILECNDTGSSSVLATFDLTAGTVSALSKSGSGSISGGSTSITPYANGWYRCAVTGIPNASGGIYVRGLVRLINGSGATNYVGDGVSGLLLWGAQINSGGVMDYVPTLSAASTGPSAVIGTDLTVDLSRDGGTTWNAASLTRLGAFDGAYAVVKARANVSGQPSGTALKVRINTLNNKAQRIATPALYAE